MAIEYTTWNPDDKAAGITLSNGNLTALSNSGYSSVRSVLGVNEGKYYWEVTVDVAVAQWQAIATSAASLTIDPASDANIHGYYKANGYKTCTGAGVSYGNSYTAGDIIGIALDMDNGKVWFSKNGVWQASGDPANGTNPACDGLSGIYYAMWPGWSNDQVTANFGASVFSYSAPNGFNSGFYSGSPVVFTFSSPIPIHLSTVYGTTKQLQLTTTVSGEEESYTYDAAFYNNFDVQIGTTVSGINSGQPAESNVYLSTPSGIDYNWYVTVTSSGNEDTSSTYTFSNRFLYEGYVTENSDPVSRVVRLYYRDTGELIDSTTSSGGNGYYSFNVTVNDEHFIIAFDDEAGEDYNSLILDRLLPNEE